MRISIGRILSLVVGIGYCTCIVIAAVANAKAAAEVAVSACQGCAVVFVPVAFIWFPEEIGAATGFIGHGVVDVETPPVLVTVVGWVFLIGGPILFYLMW